MGLGSSRPVSVSINDYLQHTENAEKYRSSFATFKENFNGHLNSGTIKLIEQMKSPFKPSFHWYSCTLGAYSSTGEAFNKNKAIIRSLGEIYERIPIFSDLTAAQTIQDGRIVSEKVSPLRDSNGLSFGLNLNDCLLRSYKELVERHVILDYWSNKKPAQRIKNLSKYSFFSFLYKNRVDIDCRFLLLDNNYGFKVVVCNLFRKDRPPYNIFGYGSDENLDSAMEKAFLEAWRFFWNLEIQKESTKTGAPKSITKCEDHFEFYCYNKLNPDEVFEEGKTQIPDETIKFKVDKITFFDLSQVGYAGLSLKAIRNDFHPFDVGALKGTLNKRIAGEVHPIA